MPDFDSAKGFAFFDVDETLIAEKSMISFQRFWYRVRRDRAGAEAFEEEMTRLTREKAPRDWINRRYYAFYAGRAVVEVDRVAADWFVQLEETRPDLYHSAVVAELGRHQAQGREAVFVSGSFPALLGHLASRLAVRRWLAAQLEVEGSVYTGRILPPSPIGQGKAQRIGAFLAAQGVRPYRCYAYGDHVSDLPMLEAVGHPAVVAGNPDLEAHARANGWPVLPPNLDAGAETSRFCLDECRIGL